MEHELRRIEASGTDAATEAEIIIRGNAKKTARYAQYRPPTRHGAVGVRLTGWALQRPPSLTSSLTDEWPTNGRSTP
jgi:hypothetical protein